MIRGDNKEKQSQLAQFRAVLDWFERHDVSLPDSGYFQNSCHFNAWVTDTDGGRAVLTDLVKACLLDKIKVEKIYNEGSFTLRFALAGASVRFSCGRELVCESRVIGTKIVPAVTYPEHIENVVEWTCKDSLLAPEVDENA